MLKINNNSFQGKTLTSYGNNVDLNYSKILYTDLNYCIGSATVPTRLKTIMTGPFEKKKKGCIPIYFLLLHFTFSLVKN